MADDPDDDAALSWAGDEKDAPPARVEYVTAPQPTAAQTPGLLLVLYGILGGAYAIYTLGWVISVQRYNATVPTSTDPLAAIMFGLGEILAIAAPALWVGAVFLLTLDRRPLIRLLWLVVGLVAVLPWPFLLGVWR